MANLFNEAYYLNAKLKQLASTGETDAAGKPYTLNTLKQAIADAGMTPEAHYAAFGRAEQINPNAYFNEAEYLQAKLAQVQSKGEKDANGQVYTLVTLKQAIADAGLSPAEHYERYGAFETKADGTLINPSNAFDSNAYYAAKLQQMITKGESLNGKPAAGLSVTDVVKAVQNAGLSAVSHYQQFGSSEAGAQQVALVQTVPSEQRVANDPARASVTGENVPSNYNKASAGPADAKASAVTKPADVGGLAPETVSPPVTTPKDPVKAPGESGYVKPPASLVDTNEKPVIPPSTSGTGNASDGWVTANPDGSGTVTNPDGTPGGTLPPGTVKPGEDGKPVLPDVKPTPPGGDTPGGDTPPAETPASITIEQADTVNPPVNIKGSLGSTGVTVTVKNNKFYVGDATTPVDNVEVGNNSTIDASTLSGTGTLNLDIRDMTATVVAVKGGTASKSAFTVRAVDKVEGGSADDSLTIVSTGNVGTSINLGGGKDSILVKTGGNLDMSKIVLTGGEVLKIEAEEGSILTGKFSYVNAAASVTLGAGVKVQDVAFKNAGDTLTLGMDKSSATFIYSMDKLAGTAGGAGKIVLAGEGVLDLSKTIITGKIESVQTGTGVSSIQMNYAQWDQVGSIINGHREDSATEKSVSQLFVCSAANETSLDISGTKLVDWNMAKRGAVFLLSDHAITSATGQAGGTTFLNIGGLKGDITINNLVTTDIEALGLTEGVQHVTLDATTSSIRSAGFDNIADSLTLTAAQAQGMSFLSTGNSPVGNIILSNAGTLTLTANGLLNSVQTSANGNDITVVGWGDNRSVGTFKGTAGKADVLNIVCDTTKASTVDFTKIGFTTWDTTGVEDSIKVTCGAQADTIVMKDGVKINVTAFGTGSDTLNVKALGATDSAALSGSAEAFAKGTAYVGALAAADTAGIAAALNAHFTSGKAANDTAVFVLSNGGNTSIYVYSDANGNTSIDAGELTLLGTVNGALGVGDISVA